jgi:hypothetical protein
MDMLDAVSAKRRGPAPRELESDFQMLEAAGAMNCSSPGKLEAADVATDVVGVHFNMPDCELCDDEPGHAATHRCIQCDQFMCDALGKVHNKFKGTRHHNLQTIAEFGSEFSDMVGEVERGADAAADAVTAAQKMQESMSRDHAKTAETIKRCCRAVQDAVSEHENTALLDLRRGSAQAKKALDMQIEGLEAAKSALAAGREYVRSKPQGGHNPRLLMGSLQKLLEQERAPTTVCKSACLTLSTDTEPVLAALGQFCTPQFDFTAEGQQGTDGIPSNTPPGPPAGTPPTRGSKVQCPPHGRGAGGTRTKRGTKRVTLDIPDFDPVSGQPWLRHDFDPVTRRPVGVFNAGTSTKAGNRPCKFCRGKHWMKDCEFRD